MAIETYQKAIARDEVQEMIRARQKARMDYESGMASARARGHAEGREQGRAQERANNEAERKRGRQEAKWADQVVSPEEVKPRRFHGSVELDCLSVGLQASKIAAEVISRLASLVDAEVTITLDIEAKIPSGASAHLVRTVTENAR